jgi:hypothetical protein
MTAALAHMSEETDRLDRAEEAMRSVAEEHIAQLHNPVDYSSYERRNETIVLALVIAKPDEPGARAWWASTDGDPENVKTFPKSIIKIVHSECDGKFVLATMKGYVAIERHLKQGPIPGLTRSVKWSDEQRAGWKNIQSKITRVRENLRNSALGRRKSNWSYAIPRRGAG